MSPSAEPGRTGSPDPASAPLAIAHRGWHNHNGRHGVHLENTMEAFRAAYAAGCDMVEFDVQLTRDGVPFIFHDDDGGRLAGRNQAVYDLDWKDLKDWTLPPSPRGQPGDYHLPTLEQFLEEFGSKAFYLELKVPQAKADDPAYWQTLGEKCAALVHASNPQMETFLASFHAPLLAHLAHSSAYPNLVGIFESLDAYQEARKAQAPLRRYSLSWGVYQDSLRSAPSPALPNLDPDRILLWDLQSEEDMRAAKAMGVYGLCADDVESMVKVCKGL